MGLFSKRKNAKDPSSAPLSESEIHRKLYGEFGAGQSRTIFRDREPKDKDQDELETKGTGPAPDLFSAPSVSASETGTTARSNRPVIRAPENISRTTALPEFEKKKSGQSDKVDAQTRYRPAMIGEKKVTFFATALSAVCCGLKTAADPRRVVLRKILYWSAAVIVVFSLFWGVNALNSQREEAMKTGQAGSRPSQAAPEVVPEVLVQGEERPVVITPARTRPRPAEREVVVTTEPPASQAPVEQAREGQYAIQIVTYPGRTDAEQVVEALNEESLKAFIRENKRPSGRVFYVVYIGGYSTEEEAQSELKKFLAREIARPFQDAFVRKV
ncbi:MAG: SPOR domain-containing protein [Candidatus Omnitrophica bacterium]|nr:SPOR domain-containing protein [Candidatus Omnitrophota bacterium]